MIVIIFNYMNHIKELRGKVVCAFGGKWFKCSCVEVIADSNNGAKEARRVQGISPETRSAGKAAEADKPLGAPVS